MLKLSKIKNSTKNVANSMPMRLFDIAGQPVDGIDVQVRVPSAAKSMFFFPGFNVLRGEAGNDGPGLIVLERRSMKVSAIDGAAPSSQPKEEAFAEPGPADQGMFLSPGDCVVGVCQDDPGGKLIIVVEVMPPSECRLSIDKLPMLNA